MGRIRQIVETVLHKEKCDAGFSITFLGIVRMRQLNRRHKGHDWPTDVLSFPLPAPDGTLMGDIYICSLVARQQARRFGVSERQEFTRLIVHGILHVLGYEHPDDAGREHSPMWLRQEKYVRLLAGKGR